MWIGWLTGSMIFLFLNRDISVRKYHGPVKWLRPVLPQQTWLPAKFVMQLVPGFPTFGSANAFRFRMAPGGRLANGSPTISAIVAPPLPVPFPTTEKCCPVEPLRITFNCQPPITL